MFIAVVFRCVKNEICSGSGSVSKITQKAQSSSRNWRRRMTREVLIAITWVCSFLFLEREVVVLKTLLLEG